MRVPAESPSVDRLLAVEFGFNVLSIAAPGVPSLSWSVNAFSPHRGHQNGQASDTN